MTKHDILSDDDDDTESNNGIMTIEYIVERLKDISNQFRNIAKNTAKENIDTSLASNLMKEVRECLINIHNADKPENDFSLQQYRQDADHYRRNILNLASYLGIQFEPLDYVLYDPVVRSEDTLLYGQYKTASNDEGAFINFSEAFEKDTSTQRARLERYYNLDLTEPGAEAPVTRTLDFSKFQSDGRPHLKKIDDNKFNLEFQPYYIHVLYQKVMSGHEEEVIKNVDNVLNAYRENCQEVLTAKDNRKDAILYDKSTNHESVMDGEDKYSMRAIHTTTLGAFNTASFFLGSGFRAIRFLSRLEHVESQQNIVSSIPICHHDLGVKYLFQNRPEEFLSPYNVNELLEPAERGYSVNAQYALDMPILSVSQLQISSFLIASLGLRMIPTLMKAIDNKIDQLITSYNESKGTDYTSEDLNALVSISLNWSTVTIFVRCYNFTLLTDVINDLASLKLRDFYSAMEPVEGLNVKFDRYQGILERLGNKSSNYDKKENINLQDIEESGSFIFINSNTTVNLLYPFTKNAGNYEYEIEHNKNALKANNEVNKKYSRWKKMTGQLRSITKFDVINGNADEMVDILNSLCKNDDKSREANRSNFYLFGFYDYVISDNDLFDRELSTIDGEPYEEVQARRVLGRIFLAKKLFLLKAHETVQDQEQSDTRPPSGLSLAISSTYIGGDISNHENEINYTDKRIGELYENIINKYKTTPNSFKQSFKDVIVQLKYKGLQGNYIDKFSQINAAWISALSNLRYASSMLELATAWFTSFTLLRNQAYDPNSTTEEIQQFLSSFCEPFHHAAIQRTMPDFRIEGAIDFLTDSEGALQKGLSGIDGLLKSIAALIGAPYHVATLTLVSAKPDIKINIHQFPNPYAPPIYTNKKHKKKYRPTIFGVININYSLLEEPTRIHVVFHEMVHLILRSEGCRQAMFSLNGSGERLYELINSRYSTGFESNQMWAERITEITVEFLIAWLLYRDDPVLYSKVFILQLNLDTNLRTRKNKFSDSMLIEMLSRCFIICLLLETINNKKYECNLINLAYHYTDYFGDADSGWWHNVHRFIDLNTHIGSGKDGREGRRDDWEGFLLHEVRNNVKRLLSDKDAIIYLNTIPLVWERYFTAKNRTSDGQQYGCNRRNSFKKKLDRTLYGTEDTFRNLFDDSMKQAKLKDFSFPDNNKLKDPGIRKLESLLRYCCLIRSFYTSQIKEMEGSGDVNLFAIRKINKVKNGEMRQSICFKKARNKIIPPEFSSILIDQREGTLFWVGEEARRKCTSLRIAFQMAILNLAELSTYTDFLQIIDIIDHEYPDVVETKT